MGEEIDHSENQCKIWTIIVTVTICSYFHVLLECLEVKVLTEVTEILEVREEELHREILAELLRGMTAVTGNRVMKDLERGGVRGDKKKGLMIELAKEKERDTEVGEKVVTADMVMLEDRETVMCHV